MDLEHVAGGDDNRGLGGPPEPSPPATGGCARLSFILPTFPPSINRAQLINHRQRRVSTSDEVLLWRTRAIPFVKPCRWPVEWLLKLTLEYQSPNWICKNGNLRRKDSHNLDKIAIDLMFNKWGWDDSRVVELVSLKRYGPRELIQVTLERALVQLTEVG